MVVSAGNTIGEKTGWYENAALALSWFSPLTEDNAFR
jgi:hypothetical protein